ncbi:MAG TPA: WbuC family cupin fold metalloprotein [Blastocatellia bacterium]|nr:WbuC family cupin fold metalloprotein [Blastocatellia bacterium]
MSEKKVTAITDSLLDELLAKAASSPRLRAIHCFHSGDWEHSHRMLNALKVGTYVRPHLHASEYQSEGFILLRGKLALLLFDYEGNIIREQSRILSAKDGCFGMDLPPAVWHSLVALEDTVIYEVKGHPAGGYIQERDKNFASWSPEEGSPESEKYLAKLESEARLL